MRKFTTSSDRGGVLIGNEGLEILVPNWFGDGDTKVKVMTEEEFFENFKWEVYRYWTTIDGSFNIYADDCSTDIVEETLVGEYSIYQLKHPRKYGTVLFVEQEGNL